MPSAFGGGNAASLSYVDGAPVTLPVVVTKGVDDTFQFGGLTYTVRPGTYSSMVALADAVQSAQRPSATGGVDLGQVINVTAGSFGLVFTSVPSGAIATAFAAGPTDILTTIGLTASQTIASSFLGTAAATFGGFAYTGARGDIAALSSADLVDIFAYSPFRQGTGAINQAQYDTHLEQSFFMRHVFDSLNNDPFA